MLLAEGGAVINASPDQVRQVILNLVLNAIQAMPKGGTLTIRTATQAENGSRACLVVVEDAGTGMPPEVRARVLEPFFSTRPGRMGLGLAICREIVSEHGGTLSIDSRPGEGTRVTVEIPAEKPA
jgi:signal transduction histidine kinase